MSSAAVARQGAVYTSGYSCPAPSNMCNAPIVVCRTTDVVPGSYSGCSPVPQASIPWNWKTQLCHHFTVGACCPRGPNCQFAHGIQELRTVAQNRAMKEQKTSEKRKTKLCANFSKSGSGVCPYEHRCQFIHPSDGESYRALFSETLEFDRMLKQHLAECQSLHAQRLQSPDPNERQRMEDEINMKVRVWNFSHPKKNNYYDLHAMTTGGAIKYVLDIINHMISNNIPQSLLETGRGNHSTNNFPAIRTFLLNNLNGFNGVSFVPQLGNDGILELTI
ncbi:hypothetical protein B9Z55_008041 [Caenorhabditis nigoni]|uniref:C3H1-type domain-containing protein n=1 Tax=Caenorhabditis nigoni TaxID=1611254 RepID=A0A2G5VCE0_9PELO|nr:hypothetical protein B9Z55_008041 [Caenorhabditis nigoni]